MAQKVFRHVHRVSYGECTVGNHVYYARYLDILEAARGGCFREAGLSFQHWHEQDTLFPVIEARLRYKRPARYDDVLTVAVWLTALERIRLNFAYRVVNQNDALILEAETFHVCTSAADKPKRLPEELMQCLQGYAMVDGMAGTLQ